VLDVATLHQENAALRAQVTQLIESIARLNERVAVAQRKQRKPSPPKMPGPPPTLDGDERQAFESRPQGWARVRAPI